MRFMANSLFVQRPPAIGLNTRSPFKWCVSSRIEIRRSSEAEGNKLSSRPNSELRASDRQWGTLPGFRPEPPPGRAPAGDPGQSKLPTCPRSTRDSDYPFNMTLKRLWLVSLCMILIVGFCNAASAQTVVVKLLDGHNRKPKAHFRVYIVLGVPRAQHSLDLKTDREGEVHFDASGLATFQVRPVGVVACGEQPIGTRTRDYSVADVLAHGIVTKNECGDFHPEPLRGQIIYLVRSATWSELFRN
jgi:hypothetical protein